MTLTDKQKAEAIRLFHGRFFPDPPTAIETTIAVKLFDALRSDERADVLHKYKERQSDLDVLDRCRHGDAIAFNLCGEDCDVVIVRKFVALAGIELTAIDDDADHFGFYDLNGIRAGSVRRAFPRVRQLCRTTEVSPCN